MPKKCTHEMNRLKVCAPCGQKLTLKFSFKRISKKYEDLIKKYINSNFDTENPKYPLNICDTCRVTLSEHDDTNITSIRPLPKMPNYEYISLPEITPTFSIESDCNCFICLTGRSTVHIKRKLGKSLLKDFSTVIDRSNGLHGNSPVKMLPKKVKEHQANLHICPTCFNKIGKGLNHACAKISSKVKNMRKLLSNLSQMQQDQVVVNLLKERSLDQKNYDDTIKNNNQIKLSSQGSKVRVALNEKKAKVIKVTHESLDKLQKTLRLPNRQMSKVTNFMRITAGKDAIEPNYKIHMAQNLNTLEEYYQTGYFEFDVEKIKTKIKRPVVWAYADELLERILEERNIVGNYKVKIMADGGQGFLKICMSVIPEDETNPIIKKRKLYSEGGSAAYEHTATSVYKLIILCMVPKVSETHDNLKILFELIKLNNISFKFTADLKLLLTAIGQLTATASYPCPYCFISLDKLKNSEVKNSTNSIEGIFKIVFF